MQISRDHPLRKLFSDLVNRRLYGDAQVRNPEVTVYITGLLTRFTHVRELYKIRNARGKRLEDVGELLIESNPLLEGRSFVYEREVRKHIGDYTMFLAGLFPEYVAALPKRGLRLDAFVDYIKAGKESYRVVSCFDQFEFRDEAPLFRRLAESFELCVFGLNLVKNDLERFQEHAYRGWRSQLDSGAAPDLSP
jgi:hypothetical protein